MVKDEVKNEENMQYIDSDDQDGSVGGKKPEDKWVNFSPLL